MTIHIQISPKFSTPLLRELGDYLRDSNYFFIDAANFSRIPSNSDMVETIQNIEYFFLCCNKNSTLNGNAIDLLNRIIEIRTSEMKKTVLITEKSFSENVTRMLSIDKAMKCDITCREFMCRQQSGMFVLSKEYIHGCAFVNAGTSQLYSS